jgi:hypothetical protein
MLFGGLLRGGCPSVLVFYYIKQLNDLMFLIDFYRLLVFLKSEKISINLFL